MTPANIYRPDFDDDTSRYARYGYHCQRARLGYQAGCERLGLSLWEIAPGAEGTSHFHCANEELLLVLAGCPNLLTPAGWRDLVEGEIAVFPRGARGMHALANRADEPARVLFFSEMRGPEVVIYPDLGVVGALEEMSSPEHGGFAAWSRLESATERHDGGKPDPASSPARVPDRANLLKPKFDELRHHPGFHCNRARLGQQAGCEKLGLSKWQVPGGEAAYPYHYHLVEEELVIVLEGQPSLRTPDGWRELEKGEVTAFPRGEHGAHQLVNRTNDAVDFLSLSTSGEPEIVIYPDSDKIGAFARVPGADGLWSLFRRTDAVDYYEGEEPPS